MRRGFTLIELAIVFVIIGLITGGILIANSVINTTRIQSAVRQVSQFDVAMADFKTKYQFIPGDTAAFAFQAGSYSNGNGHGNTNGLLEDDSGTPGLGRAFSGEVANFWPEMNAAGLASEVPYSAVVQAGSKLTVDGDAPNMPSMSWGVKGTGIFATNDNGYLTSTYHISGVYVVGKVTDNDGADLSFPNTATPTPSEVIEDALTPVNLLAFDQKIDDGNPATGRVVAFSQALAGAAGSCLTGSNPPAYNINVSTPACSAAIVYPIDTGDGYSGVSKGFDCGCGPGNACQSDTQGCQNWGGVWDQCNDVCNCTNGGTWTGTSCFIPPPCGSGTVYPDPGCVNTGGAWHECDGTCVCPSGYAWDGSSSCLINCGCGLGNSCPPDYDNYCANAGGTWDSCGNTCTCPASGTWNGEYCQGSCTISNCTYGQYNGYPLCSCRDDTNCASTGGVWNSNTGNCDCSNSPNGPNFNGTGCEP